MRLLDSILDGMTVDQGIATLLPPEQAQAVGTAAVSTERTGLDATTAGEVAQVVSFSRVLPEAFILAFTSALKVTWEVTSAAGAGTTGRLVARLLKTPASGLGGGEEVFQVEGPTVALDALGSFTHRLRADLPADTYSARSHQFFPDALPGGGWRRGEELTLVLTWEVVATGTGTFSASIHHDPDTEADRLVMALGFGQDAESD